MRDPCVTPLPSWTPACKTSTHGGTWSDRRHHFQNSKRALKENSSNEGSGRGVRKRALIGEFVVIVRFSKEDKQIILSMVMLSRELRRKLGEVEMVKTLRDGNLLIICRSEEQKIKAM